MEHDAPNNPYGYPSALPIVAHRDEILAALRKHSVVVVCGETGSGKTTQLPKMAHELGLAAHGRLIACTQPRRLAAVTTAERVAAELKTPVGGLVGFRHRYARNVSRETEIAFMTDGVLLAETRADPLLRRYGCIIVDEAHERSLNVDFLLGILKRILARRNDLRVIVSSATLDTARFGAFFGGAPEIVVPGRLYPVEMRYLPPPEGEERDLARDVAAAVDTLPDDGDILVFLPGERDIRETSDRLKAQRGDFDEVIPLLASLPAAEQRRAFRTGPRRRIVLATNVAETSVTIPGIRYVIDSGLARISRFMPRTQVQRLQIEPVSQASARQRAGRCGRLGPGVCVRLFSEEDFLARDAYTPPEILRTSLAGVILTMLELGLGDVAKFPFLDPPRSASVAEGFRELIELGALARDRRGEPCLSQTGRLLARMPVEPRLARMLLEASRLATLPSALPVVAFLSCEDPRRHPAEEREKARQAHARFRVRGSDFLGVKALWTWWREQSDALSQSKLRRLCKETYLSFPKMREWAELVRQLDQICRRLGLDTEHDNGGDDALHRALLTGLLGRIGRYDDEEGDYRGARGLRFALHPGSVLSKDRRPPDWIVCGELVDTTRLYARNAAKIDVGWLEAAAGDLARRHCHSPAWDPASGYVRATEQVTLYGLVIVPARRCDYARYDPDGARELFIRRGLVDGAIVNPPPEVRKNNAFLEALRQRVERVRHPELFDEDALARFFASALPEDVRSAPALKRFLRATTEARRTAFLLKKSDWWPSDAIDDADFPNALVLGGVKLRLTYRLAREDPATDGLTCTVRRREAAALRLWRADWLVPGMLREKLFWMLSVLPTAERRVLAPLDDTVAGLVAKLKPGSEPLEDAVVRTVREEWGFRISPEAWRRAKMPVHLRVRFVIRDDADGRILADARDRDEALARAGLVQTALAPGGSAAPEKATTWIFGDIPEVATDRCASWSLAHYPALHDEGDGVTLRLHAEREQAARAHADGVARLCLLALGDRALVRIRPRDLDLSAQFYLKSIAYDGEAIARDILAGAVRDAFIADRPGVRTEADFRRLLAENDAARVRLQNERAKLVTDALNGAAHLLDELTRDKTLPAETADAVETQLLWLVPRGFPRTTPIAWLRHFPRYLKGISKRLERARVSRSSDLAKEARFTPYWQRYRAALKTRGATNAPSPESLVYYRWLLEEFRISLFAQELGTSERVSEKRLDLLCAEARFP